MDKAILNPPNNTLHYSYGANSEGDSHMVQEPNPAGAAGAAAALPSAVVQNMTSMAAFLQTDIGAAWALAGELSGGSPAMQTILFGASGPALAAYAVGAAAFLGTTAVDRYFDGALHTAFLDAVEMVAGMDHGVADPYFGGDGFAVDNVKMMSEICSNWEEFWEDTPQMIAPIQHPLLPLV